MFHMLMRCFHMLMRYYTAELLRWMYQYLFHRELFEGELEEQNIGTTHNYNWESGKISHFETMNLFSKRPQDFNESIQVDMKNKENLTAGKIEHFRFFLLNSLERVIFLRKSVKNSKIAYILCKGTVFHLFLHCLMQMQRGLF